MKKLICSMHLEVAAVGFSEIKLREIGQSDMPELQGVDRLARDKDDYEWQSNMVLEAVKVGT